MAATTPLGSNTYLPSVEASGSLTVDFARNPKEFAIAKYAQYVPSKNMNGRYIEMTVEQAGRLLNDYDDLWPDGNEAPTNNGNLEQFEFKPFLTERRTYGYVIGELAAEQAAWEVIAAEGRRTAQRAMTRRTKSAITVATTSGNWPAAHTSAVSSISGVTGKWDVSTTARSDIQRSIMYGLEQILKDTLGAVKLENIMLVLSPGCARKIAQCQEIRDYVKGSADAKAAVIDGIGEVGRLGLPPRLYGVDVVIDQTVKVTTPKGGTQTKSFVLGDTTPFLCSRVGGLDGVEGPSFSTLTVFNYKGKSQPDDLTVETKYDADNKRHLGRVIQNYAAVLTAPVSGFLFTAAVD